MVLKKGSKRAGRKGTNRLAKENCSLLRGRLDANSFIFTISAARPGRAKNGLSRYIYIREP